MRVNVCIIGGGPSGLLLSQLLHLKGVDTIVLERQSREYVLGRIRAGVLEHGFADLMREAQCGERMDREGEIHHGFFIAHDGKLDRVDLAKYSGGNSVVVYGQTEVTRDLYAARDRDWAARSSTTPRTSRRTTSIPTRPTSPTAAATTSSASTAIIVVGADGFHGVSRKSIPKGVLKEYERIYPFGWLGVLSRTKPVSPELIYCKHERGFALCSLRSQVLSRYYLQVPLTDRVEDWSDEDFWDELKRRLPEPTARDARHRAVDREEHRAAAQLRRRADALRPAVPGRRRRPHRAADRRARPQQRGLRRLLSLPRADRSLRKA